MFEIIQIFNCWLKSNVMLAIVFLHIFQIANSSDIGANSHNDNSTYFKIEVGVCSLY